MHKLDIDAQTWTELNRLLDVALDLPVAARNQWLADLPAEFDALKPRLRDFLARAVQVESSDFLNTLPKFPSNESLSNQAGDAIGPYRLIRELGTGGMGSVWLAERTDVMVKRALALKLPHGAWKQTGLAERMEREREILASLEHPNIARLYDAGVTGDGQPYLALEYVEGPAIDVYSAENHLNIRERLNLFLQIAQAVAYAHGKLIVHRDLKPANILVTREGHVRLLDFGIGKLLAEGQSEETRLTESTGRALTPDYASPEQIVGKPITIGTDVYSLGVILYELLTGQRPYKLKRDSRGALEDAILETAPAPPSHVVSNRVQRRQLHGDLDTIVLKALRKDPQERYAAVNNLADDIQRYLTNQPVVARPDSRWYRMRKFVSRNRLPVVAAAAVLAAVLIGSGLALWQMVEAQQQRDAALRNQRRAEVFSEFMAVMLQDAGSGDRPLTATELLDRGTAMLERQQGMDDSLSAYMRYEIARSYQIFNQTERQLQLLEQSAAGARRIGDLNLLAAALCSSGWALSLAGRDRSPAEARLAEAEKILSGMKDTSIFTIIDCARARSMFFQNSGDIPAAIAAVQQGLSSLNDSTVGTQSGRQLLLTQLSNLYRATDRYKDAVSISEEILNLIRYAGRAGSLLEFVHLNNHAGNLSRLGEIAQADQIYEKLFQRLQRDELPNFQPVGFRSNYGTSLWRLGQASRALELAEADLLAAQRAGNTASAALSHYLAARALLQLGKLSESRSRLAAAESVWQLDPKMNTRMLREGAVHQAEIDLVGGHLSQARRSIDAVLASLAYPQRKDAPGIDRALRLAAKIYRRMGDPAKGQQLAEDALNYSRGIARDERRSADVGQAALLRAHALADHGRFPEAATDASLALEALRNGFGPDHSDTLDAIDLLARLRAAPNVK
jgi:serine/threonine protein kinase/tetratricopeptide (TPR) repeat protein